MHATKKLRVGIVGLRRGRSHIEDFRADPACEVTAVCDTDARIVEQVAGEESIAHTYLDAEELFHSGEVDAVVIATPNTLHAPQSIAALEAGLHVLCEKPMAMDAEQASSMVEAAEAADRKLAISFNHRMHPAAQFIFRHLAAGDLGEISFIRTIWHRQRGIPLRPSFLKKKQAGGGALIDLGVHMLDLALFFAGYPKVETVSGRVCRNFQEDVAPLDMDVDDFATAYLTLAGGVSIALEVSWASHHDLPEQRLIQLYGTRGGALYRIDRWDEGPPRTQVTIQGRHHGGVSRTEMVQSPLHTPTVQSDFLAAIRENREPQCSAHHGLTTMKILDALYALA